MTKTPAQIQYYCHKLTVKKKIGSLEEKKLFKHLQPIDTFHVLFL